MNYYALEANNICKYLIGENIRERELNIYENAMSKVEFNMDANEAKLWKLMNKSVLYMSCIDAGLALINSNSVLRKKIYFMLAILETSPNYTNYFLSKNHTLLYPIKIAYVGIRSLIKAFFGILIIKIYK